MLQAVCALRSAKSQRLRSQTQIIIFLKVKTHPHAFPKTQSVLIDLYMIKYEVECSRVTRLHTSALHLDIGSELMNCFGFELTERILPSLLVSCMLSIPGRAAATRRNSCRRKERMLLVTSAVTVTRTLHTKMLSVQAVGSEIRSATILKVLLEEIMQLGKVLGIEKNVHTNCVTGSTGHMNLLSWPTEHCLL